MPTFDAHPAVSAGRVTLTTKVDAPLYARVSAWLILRGLAFAIWALPWALALGMGLYARAKWDAPMWASFTIVWSVMAYWHARDVKEKLKELLDEDDDDDDDARDVQIDGRAVVKARCLACGSPITVTKPASVDVDDLHCSVCGGNLSVEVTH